MKNRSKALTGAILAVGLIVAGATSAQAFSNSRSVTLPGTNINLQANAWSQSVLSGGRADFATSSKATVNGSAKAVATIKNTATIEARGVNASISVPGGVSVGGSASAKSLSWTNNNAWISDLGGTASYSGLTVSVHANSAAFAVHQGVKNYVDVWSW